MRVAHGGLGVVLGLVAACSGATAQAPAPKVVRPGLEVLLSDSAHLVRGRRVGLVTNQSGVDRSGVSGVDRLLQAGVRLVALFSPEHGFRGTADPGAAVLSTTDSATGLPIYSLYGRNSAPADSVLAELDVVLVDLQDAGARYYTYLWTTVEVMRAAAAHGLPVIVLDRPNPIGGATQGNVLDTAYRSAVGLLAIPMRHGMTLGELARLAKSDLGLTTDLTVVPVDGWRRTLFYDQTGLPFVPPSPNLRTLGALLHYPGLCLFEGTALSVGRGTDHPFEQIGAPWLDTAGMLARMRAARLPGVAFAGVTFTPHRAGDGKFEDTTVVGIRLTVTDRDRYDPTVTALHLLDAVTTADSGARLLPSNRRHLERLLGAPIPSVVQGEVAGSWGRLPSAWQAPLAAFLGRRQPFLLYEE